MALGGADNLARSPELRTKLLWTLGLLCAYRIGVHIPVPGVDGGALAHFFESVAGTLFGLFDMFSGGGLRNVSVFALGIMPYISASIILQLLQVVSPELKRMAKEEGAAGRRKITQYTRYSIIDQCVEIFDTGFIEFFFIFCIKDFLENVFECVVIFLRNCIFCCEPEILLCV
mgnify:CR=1 FL=1